MDGLWSKGGALREVVDGQGARRTSLSRRIPSGRILTRFVDDDMFVGDVIWQIILCKGKDNSLCAMGLSHRESIVDR